MKITIRLAVMAIMLVGLPATGHAENDATPRYLKSGERGGNSLWSIPPGTQPRWNNRARDLDWTIPDASRRWTERDARLRWTIPGTAADLQR